MSTAKSKQRARTAVLENPLDGEQLLLDVMYGARPAQPQPALPAGRGATQPALPAGRAAARPVRSQPKPEHYKVVSISLYTEDIERLDRLVRELKRRGHYKANKSQVIRHALAQLDLDRIPRDR